MIAFAVSSFELEHQSLSVRLIERGWHDKCLFKEADSGGIQAFTSPSGWAARNDARCGTSLPHDQNYFFLCPLGMIR